MRAWRLQRGRGHRCQGNLVNALCAWSGILQGVGLAGYTSHEIAQVQAVSAECITSDIVPVSLVSSVLLPTEGNPTRPTLASPTLFTSKPACAQGHHGLALPHCLELCVYTLRLLLCFKDATGL